VWHAASSGGTTAGLGWAADRLGLDVPIVACSIGDTADEIEHRVREIWREAAAEFDALLPSPNLEVTDAHVGGGYGVVSTEELEVQRQATTLTGLLLDPTYTGKALYGLRREIDDGRYAADDHVVFWHTGGGFAVFSYDFGDSIRP
jgi:1-aminocyclopropane-1-carboxylate deaminase/D-cysteine desulfhydrase-like pyridoxal-dependent ACC family enzyme